MFSRFQELKEHQDDRTETMLNIYEESPAKRDTGSKDRYWRKPANFYLGYARTGKCMTIVLRLWKIIGNIYY